MAERKGYAVPDPDGYCRYACPECGAILETTLSVKGIKVHCYDGWYDAHGKEKGCGGASRTFHPAKMPGNIR